MSFVNVCREAAVRVVISIRPSAAIDDRAMIIRQRCIPFGASRPTFTPKAVGPHRTQATGVRRLTRHFAQRSASQHLIAKVIANHNVHQFFVKLPSQSPAHRPQSSSSQYLCSNRSSSRFYSHLHRASSAPALTIPARKSVSRDRIGELLMWVGRVGE